MLALGIVVETQRIGISSVIAQVVGLDIGVDDDFAELGGPTGLLCCPGP